MKTLFFAILFATSFAHAASDRIVECTADHRGQKETVQVKFDTKGEYHLWTDTQVANAPAGSMFEPFNDASVDDEGGLEYISEDSTPGGYMVLKIGTTADEHQIAIKPDLSKAYWKYVDLGSGAGDSFGRMTCVEIGN